MTSKVSTKPIPAPHFAPVRMFASSNSSYFVGGGGVGSLPIMWRCPL